MGLGLLLLPALGGYWMLTRCRWWKFGALKDSGYHLVFSSASVGVFLTAISALLLSPFWFRVPDSWLQCAMSAGGMDSPPSLVQASALLAVALGFGLPYTVNWRIDENEAAGRAARERGDLIESVLHGARHRVQTVEIVLCDGKTYIGYVLSIGLGRDTSDPDISLMPVVSGYRTHKKKQLRIVVDYYDKVYSRAKSEVSGIALPLKDVRSARLFDLDLYAEAQSGEE